MTVQAMILRLVVSFFLGAFLGMEREMHKRAAGFRTHILVSIGSTLFMMTSIFVAETYSSDGTADPARIAAGVVTGIGFLGAGAIIRYGESIKGLTTAASIWIVAAIGLATGAGLYIPAIFTTLIALVVLVLSKLQERFDKKRKALLKKKRGSDPA